MEILPEKFLENKQTLWEIPQGISTENWTDIQGLEFFCPSSYHISITYCCFSSEELLNFSKLPFLWL